MTRPKASSTKSPRRLSLVEVHLLEDSVLAHSISVKTRDSPRLALHQGMACHPLALADLLVFVSSLHRRIVLIDELK